MNVSIHAEAEVELGNAVEYYENCVLGLGRDLRKEVEKSIERLQSDPERWPKATKRTRRIQVHRFPYSVIYVIQVEGITIVAFAHQKRRPGYWSSRI